MATASDITPDLCRKLLRYCPETGRLFWRMRDGRKEWNTRYAGEPALNSGRAGHYRSGRILDVNFYAHRAAWAIYYGNLPSGCIDHINGDKTDNRICNLRDVSRAENNWNMPLYANNKSGVAGVSWSKRERRWKVQAGSPKVHLGTFMSLDAAVAARHAFEQRQGMHRR